jgi:hypothetical protein
MSEGDVTVEVLTSDAAIPPKTCRIHTDFWTRIFDKYTFVINPDQLATLMLEKVWYSESGDEGQEPEAAFHVGQLLTEFREVDYVFKPFPDQVTTQQESGFLIKTRLDLVRDVEATLLMDYIAEEQGADAAIDYARHLVSYVPEVPAHFVLLITAAGEQEAVATIRPLLARRPLLMDAHRFYQQCMANVDPEHDLVGEYRSFLAEEPANADLVYLVGRAVKSRAKVGEPVDVLLDRLIEGVDWTMEGVEPEQYHDWLRGVLSYADGDLEGFMGLTADSTLASTKFERAVSAGRVEDAARMLGDKAENSPEAHLILYLAAAQAGLPQLEEAHLARAVELLKGRGGEQEQVGAWLAGAEAPDPTGPMASCISSQRKRIVLAALGTRFPDQRQGYFELARKMNYDRNFPHLFLSDVLEAKPGKSASMPAGVTEG